MASRMISSVPSTMFFGGAGSVVIFRSPSFGNCASQPEATAHSSALFQKLPREEIHAAPAAVGGLRGAVAGAGDHQELEVLAGFLQRMNDLHGARGIDVGIEIA